MARPCFKLEKFYPEPLAGVDEAGCAPLAGPVVAAAVILDREKFPRGIDDSKALPAPVREAICARLYKVARVGVGLATVEEIDRINIFWARMLAMSRAVERARPRPGDDPGRRQSLPEMGAPVGLDRRRRHQVPLDRRRLDRRQGHPRPDHERLCAGSIPATAGRPTRAIGTPEHYRGLDALGPTPLHRRSFAPVRHCLAARDGTSAVGSQQLIDL